MSRCRPTEDDPAFQRFLYSLFSRLLELDPDAQRITPNNTEQIKRFGEFTINLTPTIHITDDFMTLPPNLAPADNT